MLRPSPASVLKTSTVANRGLSLVLVFVVGVMAESTALAGKWDLKLSRLCQLQTTDGQTVDCGRGLPNASDVGVRGPNAVIPDNAAFRSLMSELGVMFAPNVLSPAETMGYNGFHFGLEFGMVTLNPKKNAGPNRFWRAAESVRDVDLASVESTERNLPPSVAPTLTLMMRKGVWFPGPSFEFGFGVRHLIDSRMWAGIATAKVALHEGFQGWPVPALAVRGSASRVFGTPDFNLTVAALDFFSIKSDRRRRGDEPDTVPRLPAAMDHRRLRGHRRNSTSRCDRGKHPRRRGKPEPAAADSMRQFGNGARLR